MTNRSFTIRRTVAFLLLGSGATASLVWGPMRASFADPVPFRGQPSASPVRITGVRTANEPAPSVVARAQPFDSAEPADPFANQFRLSARETSPKPIFGGSTRPNEVATPRGPSIFPPMPSTEPGSNNVNFDPRMQQQPPSRGVFGSVANWTSDKFKSVKSAISGTPDQPQARVGQQPPPMPPMGQPAMPMGQPVVSGPGMPMGSPMMGPQPFRGTTPSGRIAYAGNPAYRWYGWGTTTPGTNPYAPTGEYPSASGQWYAMSGATPGAFPVPVTHPFRSAPGAEPPAYASRTPAPRTNTPGSPMLPGPSFATVDAAPTVPTTGPRTIAESPPFRYIPPQDIPATTSAPVAPAVPPSATNAEWRGWGGPISTNTAPPPAESEPVRTANLETNWQPVSYTAPIPTATTTSSTMIGQSAPPTQSDSAWQPLTAPVKPTPTPTPAPASTTKRPRTLQDLVKAAAGSGVSEVEVKPLGANAIVIRFNAPTDAVAEAAARSIARLTELEKYTVTYDAAVSGK